MKYKLLILAAAAFLTVGCKHNNTPTTEPQQRPQVVFGGFTDTVELELAPAPEARPAKRASTERTASATTETRQGATASQPKATSSKTAETIYVETDGAQGRVWGHVTMKGDRGTGTIHDWDENTLAVSVTRHGDELFAVDQNSRQYVFKLKK